MENVRATFCERHFCPTILLLSDAFIRDILIATFFSATFLMGATRYGLIWKRMAYILTE